MRICVYCSSSSRVGDVYVQAAQRLGEEMALRGHELVYGGGGVGLMGVLARAVHSRGGRVTGVIPSSMMGRDVAYLQADELIVTADMAERKGLMISRAEAFVALPGGLGTLEELSEVLTLKQLAVLDRALVLINVQGFYDQLIGFFDQLIALEFAHPDHRELYHLAAEAGEALDWVESYAGCDVSSKWF